MSDYLVQFNNISKFFGKVIALKDVTMKLRKGEIMFQILRERADENVDDDARKRVFGFRVSARTNRETLETDVRGWRYAYERGRETARRVSDTLRATESIVIDPFFSRMVAIQT